MTVFVTFSAGTFSSIAPVGQTDRHWPQLVHIESARGASMKVPMRLVSPAPRKSIAPMSCAPSWHPCAHRPHRMQSRIAMSKTGLLLSTGSRSRPTQRPPLTPWCLAAIVSSWWSFAPLPSTIAIVSSMTPVRTRSTSGVSVSTFMPGTAGIVHEAGKPRAPSTSTRQVRHAAFGPMSGSLQSCGT